MPYLKLGRLNQLMGTKIAGKNVAVIFLFYKIIYLQLNIINCI
jgi:hypothetical protein